MRPVTAMLMVVLVGACAPEAPVAPEIEIRVLATGPLEDGLLPIIERYTSTTGNTVSLETGTTPVVTERLESGDVFDVVIATQAVLDAAEARGQLDASSAPVMGRVGVGIAVRDDIEVTPPSNAAGLEALLLSADSIAYNRGSSGVYVHSMIDELGMAETLAGRITRYDNGTLVLDHVRDGAGRDFGLAPMTEIQANAEAGVRMVPLPDDVQNYTTYHVAVGAEAVAAAGDFVDFLETPESREAFRSTGVE